VITPSERVKQEGGGQTGEYHQVTLAISSPPLFGDSLTYRHHTPEDISPELDHGTRLVHTESREQQINARCCDARL